MSWPSANSAGQSGAASGPIPAPEWAEITAAGREKDQEFAPPAVAASAPSTVRSVAPPAVPRRRLSQRQQKQRSLAQLPVEWL